LPYYEYCKYLDFLIKDAGSTNNEKFELDPGDANQ